jgi:hypothetical protein
MRHFLVSVLRCKMAPIDKLSVAAAIVLAVVFLGEAFMLELGLSIAHAIQAIRVPGRRLALAPHKLSVGDASWTLRRRSEQRITRSSAGEHSEEIRDLRVDLQLSVLFFVNGLYTHDGPIHFPGELFNSASVKRLVVLVLV